MRFSSTLSRAGLAIVIALSLSAIGHTQDFQPIRTGDRLAWEQVAKEGDQILPPSYTYFLRLTNRSTSVVSTTPIAPDCVQDGSNPLQFNCTASLIPLPVGAYDVAVFARITLNNLSNDSGDSNVLELVSLVIEIPRNARIVSGGE